MGSANSNVREYGFRILKIHDAAPASKKDFWPFTDFIVNVKNAPENFSFDKDFYKFIISNENKEISLIVYNILDK